MLLSKKAIITINKDLGEKGIIVNEASLGYAIDMAKKSRNWLKSLSTLVRAILIDHVFEDGNKRTAAVVIMVWLEMRNLAYDKDKINQLIIKILKKNITNIDKISRLIKNAAI